MKHADIVLPDGKRVVIDASGSFLRERDATTRVLHLLPQLFVPLKFLRWLDVGRVNLEVVCGLPLIPHDDLVIRQPMPDTRYFVGCSKAVRYGWFYPLPDGISNIDVEFRWFISPAHKSGQIEPRDFIVRHKIHLSFVESAAGNTYTMDSICWPTEYRIGRLYAWMGVNDDDRPDRTTARSLSATMSQRLDVDGIKLAVHLINESVEIPAIKLDQLWTISEFEHERLHELEHCSRFSRFKELHENNATCVCPRDLFIDAVQLARTVPFSSYENDCEDHPANLLLAGWWQNSQPELAKCPVGFAMPWVRVQNDERYWCGYYETPDEPMTSFARTKTSQARVDDFVLLMFYTRKQHFIPFFDGNGLTLVLASGEKDTEIIGVDIGEVDQAWYALEALRCFPVRFPEVWRSLNNGAAR